MRYQVGRGSLGRRWRQREHQRAYKLSAESNEYYDIYGYIPEDVIKTGNDSTVSWVRDLNNVARTS